VCQADASACAWDAAKLECNSINGQWKEHWEFRDSRVVQADNGCGKLSMRVAMSGATITVKPCAVDDLLCKLTARLVRTEFCQKVGQVIPDAACARERASPVDNIGWKSRPHKFSCSLVALNERSRCEAMAKGENLFCADWIVRSTPRPQEEPKKPSHGGGLDKISGGIIL
jgi:hypothetical protein